MFSERLRALRKTAGLTQEELARKANVSNATVAKLERVELDQDPSWSTVLTLAKALGVSVAEFDEEEVPSSPQEHGKKGKGKKGGAK